MLVHGLVIPSRYMVPLAPDFPVYAPDLPGFGESDKPRRVLAVPELAEALHAWMRAIGLPRAALVANSFGCQIVAELAARHPEAVDRLVLQGPTVDAGARSLPVQVWRTLRNGRMEPPALGRISAVDYAKAGLGRAVRTTRAMMRDRIEDKLPRVRAPTLVVRGSRDPVVPQAWAERVARTLSDGRLVVVEGGAHLANPPLLRGQSRGGCRDGADAQGNSTASTTAITVRTSNTAKTMNVTERFVGRPSPRGLAL